MANSGGGLGRVVALMYLNLAISLTVGVFTYLHFKEVVDFQLTHLPQPPEDPEATRATLTKLTWARLAAVVVLALLYVKIAGRLSLGLRRTYFRVFVLSLGGVAGMGYLALAGQSPEWMRVGQGAQAAVLLFLFFAVLRSRGVCFQCLQGL